jgi:Ca2+-binding EF-hand superfamily protein
MNRDDPENDKDLREAVINIFKAYDTDGSGQLEIDEVITLINDTFFHMKQSKAITQKEVRKFIMEQDKDGDGKISEF